MKTTTFRFAFATALLILPLLLIAGCGDDDSPASNGGAPNDEPGQSGVVQGNLVPKGGDFEMPSSTDGDGPEFTLRGQDISYDTDSGELVVNLSVINDGAETYDEGVTLSFLSLLPEGVTVTNPDNEENGVGAMIDFEFENDDAMWTPGEESLPRETRFGVEEDVAIGFAARVDVGMGTAGMGSIGGIVFDDADGDGMMGTEESGVAGVTIVLSQEGADDQMVDSGEDGSYRFDGLDTGFYTVSKQTDDDSEMDDGMTPTTPTTIHVILVEDGDGMVVSFMAANFGCMADGGSPFGEITGVVYDDANENGMMDEGEMGVADVDVAMMGPNGLNGVGTTDENGEYIFSSVDAGDYTVSITVPDGYTATTDASVTVTLMENEDTTIDFGIAVDGGSPFGEITGVVYDDANENGMMDEGELGVADVDVAMMGPNGLNGVGTTNENGEYIFSSVDAGDYTVSITVPDGYTATTDASVTVTLMENEDTTIDFGIAADGGAAVVRH